MIPKWVVFGKGWPYPLTLFGTKGVIIMLTLSDHFDMQLGQHPPEATGLFAHLVAHRLRLLDTHTTPLSDH